MFKLLKLFIIFSILFSRPSLAKRSNKYFKHDRTATLEQVRKWAEKSNLPWEVREEYMEAWNFYWGTHAGRMAIKKAMEKNKSLILLVEEKIKEKGLPGELAAIPMAETSYNNLKASRRWGNGAGLWMFQPGTARAQGLIVSKKRDERLDIQKLSHAALTLLASYYEKFKSWPMALLAYNKGPMAAENAMKKGDLTYVGKITAMAILMKNPNLLEKTSS